MEQLEAKWCRFHIGGEEVEEQNTENMMKEMKKEIDNFMGRYKEAFQRRHDGQCQ